VQPLCEPIYLWSVAAGRTASGKGRPPVATNVEARVQSANPQPFQTQADWRDDRWMEVGQGRDLVDKQKLQVIHCVLRVAEVPSDGADAVGRFSRVSNVSQIF